MYTHFMRLLEKMELPREAQVYLAASVDAVIPSCAVELQAAVQHFYRRKFKLEAITDELTAIGEKSGVNQFTVNFLFLACASKYMLEDYQRAGLSEELFFNTIMDMKYKLFECHTVKGVWGTFVEFWYPIFFSLDIFKLGRLEFERSTYRGEDRVACGLTIKDGDTVYNVHIPSCGSLAKELRMDSYRRAYAFFAEERGKKPLICLCHSWLLFEGNREIFPATLNMVDFMNDWQIVKSEETEKFDDAWRVFGMDFNGDVSALPQETTQQKALAAWLGKGKKTGEGLAVLVFDGEKLQ